MHLWLEKKLNIHPYIYLFPNYTPVVARCVHHTASLVYHTIFMFGKIDLKKKLILYLLLHWFLICKWDIPYFLKIIGLENKFQTSRSGSGFPGPNEGSSLSSHFLLFPSTILLYYTNHFQKSSFSWIFE